MKKQYKKPTLSTIVFDMQPLMVLSNSDNPQTEVNPNLYNEEFGAREFDFNDDW